MDGTLLDSNDAHARAWVDVFRAFGHRVAFARVRRLIGKGGSELSRDFLSKREHHFLASAMGARQGEAYLERFDRIAPLDGAARTVREMAGAGVRVVLASSAQKKVVERSIALLRIGRVLTGFTTADDVAKAKPFDDIFTVAIRRFRLDARTAVAIGDTPYDIAAAHQIGLRCLAVRTGGFPEKTLSNAEAVYDDLPSLWRAERAAA